MLPGLPGHLEAIIPNQLEEQAFGLLRDRLPGFYLPDRDEKRQVRSWLNISDHFRSAFDALLLKVEGFKQIQSPSDFTMVEIKVTRKFLPNLANDPRGFFFGITENEEMLLKVFGQNASLCLVSVNPESEGYFLADWDTFQGLSMNKRIQYQINVRNPR